MPIYLAPRISRRKFLIRSVVAAAGLALGPNLFARDKKIDRHSWALLADTHIAGNRFETSRGVNMADHLAAVTRDVIALPSRPAGVLVGGDCALDSGEKEDYATLTELLEPLRQARIGVHLALGNHDDRRKFWEVLPAERVAPRTAIDRQVALVSTSRANWFILDSYEETLTTPGLLGQVQLDWLARELDANRRKPALVLVHHHPVALPTHKVAGLNDGDALFHVLRPRKQVKACLFGHTHFWSVTQDPSGIHLINLPPVSYIFRGGGPIGWVHAHLQRRGISLELRCVNTGDKAHGQVTELKWR